MEIFRVSSETFKLSDQTLEAFSNKSETIIEIVQNAAEANSEKLAVVHIALDHMNFDQLSQGSLFLQDICRAPDVGSANGLGKLLFIFFNIQQ